MSRCIGSIPRYRYRSNPSFPNASSYGPFGAVVIESGTSMTLGLKIPCGPRRGTRCPANWNRWARTVRGMTSPFIETCIPSQSNAEALTRASSVRSNTVSSLPHDYGVLITFRASEPAQSLSFTTPAFFVRSPLLTNSHSSWPVGSRAAYGGPSRRPTSYRALLGCDRSPRHTYTRLPVFATAGPAPHDNLHVAVQRIEKANQSFQREAV